MRRILVSFSLVALLLGAQPLAALAAPSGTAEPTYANGTVVYMSAPVRALGASLSHGSAVVNKAYALYLAIYPVAADGFDASRRLINGWYAPQCDPCFHFGVPDPNLGQYHDHIVEGAPGFGTNGTAGSYSPAWRVFILVYNMDYIASHPAWTPVTSDEGIDAAVAAGEFLFPPIDTGVVFLCNLTSANAH
jgi:hypothetical protein